MVALVTGADVVAGIDRGMVRGRRDDANDRARVVPRLAGVKVEVAVVAARQHRRATDLVVRDGDNLEEARAGVLDAGGIDDIAARERNSWRNASFAHADGVCG